MRTLILTLVGLSTLGELAALAAPPSLRRHHKHLAPMQPPSLRVRGGHAPPLEAGVGTELEVHLPVGDPVDGGGRWATLDELREPPLLVLPVLHAVRQQRLAEAEARRQEGEKREVQAVVSSLLLRVERQSNEAKGLVASAAAHRHIPAGAAPCAAAIAASSAQRPLAAGVRPYGYPGAPPAGYAQPPGVLGAPPGAVVVQGGNGPRLVTGGNAAPSGGYQWVNQGLTYPPSGYGGYGGYPAYTPQHSAVNGAVLTAAQQQRFEIR